MQNLFNKFADVRVLVIGDLMLDRYWWGSVERISPEAPVPIIKLEDKSETLGGAANVAANINGLNAKPILFGLLGDDEEAKEFLNLSNQLNIDATNVFKTERSTTVKTRIIATNQQIVRIDQETTQAIDKSLEKKILEKIDLLIDDIDVLILSDYAKGLITDKLAERLITLANSKDKVIVIDPKGKRYLKYKNATVLTPNTKEALEATNLEYSDESDITDAGKTLLSELKLEALIITRGEKGMKLFQKNNSIKELNSIARKVYDVTGAGDTVVATLAVAIGAGFDFESATKIANIAAGIVVEKVGTTCISFDELLDNINGLNLS